MLDHAPLPAGHTIAFASRSALDHDAIAEGYRVDGHALVPALFEPDELGTLRAALDGLFRGYHALPDGFGYNLSPMPGAGGAEGIPAIRNALQLRPELRDLAGLGRAVLVAGRLLGGRAEPLWDAAVYKPPGEPTETPWHQDGAIYSLSRLPRPRSIAYFWVALDDADAASGGIRFISGSHLGPPQPHRWAGGGMVAEGPIDESAIVAPRLRAGDATVHHLATLHGAGPNASDRWRKAWVLGIGVPRAPRWMRRIKGSLRALAGRM